MKQNTLIKKLLNHLKVSQNILDECEDSQGGFNNHINNLRRNMKEAMYEADKYLKSVKTV